MDHTKELKHISLCTGYGGIDLGLKRAIGAVRTVCFVEIEAFVIQNLVAKIEKGLLDLAPVYTNLKTFAWESFSGKVDILSGGFPCQPFSAAGNREGDQDPRHLFPFIVDGIKRLGKPSLIFLENVEGIISSKLKGDHWSDPEGTPVLLHVLRELERLGYKATAGTFSAVEVGAPHQRKRVFILGIRNELSGSAVDYVNKLIESTESKRVAYPAARGVEQYWYEPPRVQELSNNYKNNGIKRERSIIRIIDKKSCEKKTNRLARCNHNRCKKEHRQIKPKMGGDADGSTDWMDYAELYESCDNRTDELRMLGNGVVPETAARAFKTLWRELVNTHSERLF